MLVLPIPGRRLSRAHGAVGHPGAVLAAVAAVLVAVLLPVQTMLSAGAAIATVSVRRRRARRRRLVSDEAGVLIAALEVLVGELRIGAHPVAAFDVAARESTGLVARALSGVAARARLGADVVSGLAAATPGSHLGAEWNRLGAAWRLADEHGLPIAAVMRGAQADIVERQRFRRQVQSALAGARASAGILAGLPVAGLALGEVIGADPVAFLVRGGVGGWCLLTGVVLLAAGLLWADRIIDRAGR